MRRILTASCVPALAAVLAACASSGPAPPTAGRTGARPPVAEPAADLEQRALLLLVSDRRLYEPVSFEAALLGDAGLRTGAAAALGQVGDRRGRVVLERLLADPEVEVRREAVFALGELGDPESRALLRAAIGDRDRETGSLAVEAAAKVGVPLLEVGDAIARLAEEERWPRLLPHLFRFDDPALVPLAEAGLGASDAALHAASAYALARRPRPEAAPLLRPLVRDADPFVRGWAARALGEVGDGADLALLRPLLDDPATAPVVQALRSGQRLVAAGKAAAPDDWRGRLRELLADPRPHVRLTAIETSAAWLPDGEIGADLDRLAAEPSAAEAKAERGAAVVALAAGADPRAAGRTAAAATATDRDLRARAATAAGFLAVADAATGRALLDRLRADPDGKVRAAALTESLTAIGRADEAAAAALAGEALAGDTDPGVLAAAFEWAAEHPRIPLDALAEALLGALASGNVESSLNAVAALAARAEASAGDRGTIVALLERLADGRDWPVRRRAATALVALGRTPPPPGAVETRRDVAAYRAIAERLAATPGPLVDVVTSAGTVRLRLDATRAPLTCLSFLNLAAQGFYDGTTFHRVVPDFVVQGGDPRGDGYGGPPYTIRDEINRRRYRRGTVGMALAGADTGGSQFFVTLSPQPHLDGGYTAFGEVVAGDEVLDRIVPGTRIESVREVPGG